MPPRRWNTALLAACTGLLFLLCQGCDWIWPQQARYDPYRCDPSCETGFTCVEGECVEWNPAMDGSTVDGPPADVAGNDRSPQQADSSPSCPCRRA